MNQMLQEPEVQSQVPTSEAGNAPDIPERPPAPAHPRFAKPQRIAFVQSAWHREVVEECRIAFLDEIEARHIARAQVDLFEVPGSFEIPLHAQMLAKTRRYTAIVAAGLVVDGGIYRHEFVADTVIKALMDVQLRTEVPVFSAVLTPQQFHESTVRISNSSASILRPRASRSRKPAPTRCSAWNGCAARSRRGSRSPNAVFERSGRGSTMGAHNPLQRLICQISPPPRL